MELTQKLHFYATVWFYFPPNWARNVRSKFKCDACTYTDTNQLEVRSNVYQVFFISSAANGGL